MENNKENKKSTSAGRPSKYRSEFALQAKKLCMLNVGITDQHLADFFEVNIDTIHQWKKAHVEFSDSVKGGKIVADAEVAAALYKRAVGFQYDEITFEKIDGKVNLEITPDEIITTDAYKKKIVTKAVVPDTGAIMNWLKNRQREFWSDSDIDFDKLTDEQLDKLIDRITKRASKNE